MCRHHFGDISISKVTEQHGPGFAPDFLYPDWDPAVLEAHRALMVPDCFDQSQQRFIASIHTWVVKTRHHTILIDSCAGNHKKRPGLPRFHQLDLPFLERLAEAGVTPESVDYVMCTHLHVDHCGWNDIATTVQFIRSKTGVDKINLIGWSWSAALMIHQYRLPDPWHTEVTGALRFIQRDVVVGEVVCQ